MRRPIAIALAVAVALAVASSTRRAESTEPPPPLDGPSAAAADDDARLFARMADLVEARGYPLEMAPVHTTDGHRSLIFRIPRGRAEQQEQQDDEASSRRRPHPRPVVLLQHGLLGSSADFVLNDGPGESLAFALADAGFDVFLANSRGNEYGRGGVAGGGPDSSYFWSFSWDEMAAFDLPAAVDHALATAGADARQKQDKQQKNQTATAAPTSLFLVAFSQGTTAALAALASGKLDARKVERAVLMGPVAYATHVGSVPLHRLASLGTEQVLLMLGAREFSPSGELIRRLGGDACVSAPWLCVSALTALCGYSPENADSSKIPFYLNYTPSGTSVQNVAHWAQAVRGGRGGGGGGGGGDDDDDDDDGGARGGGASSSSTTTTTPRMVAYDYGRTCHTPVVRLPRPCNQVVYGSKDPPQYDLRGGKMRPREGGGGGGPPIVLITGGKDRLADPKDAAALSAALRDAGVLARLHHEPTFEHLDFLWGVRALPRVHRVVVEELLLAGGVEAAAARAAAARAAAAEAAANAAANAGAGAAARGGEERGGRGSGGGGVVM